MSEEEGFDETECDVETYTVQMATCKDTGELLGEMWFNSKVQLHRSHDLPALTEYTEGKITMLGYFQNGLEHREEGPSTQFISHRTGIVFEEYYLKNGEEVSGELASIVRDPKTGKIVHKSYNKNGKRINVVDPEVDPGDGPQKPER